MVGSALCRRFAEDNRYNLILKDRNELDLTRQLEVEKFLAVEKPEIIIIAAAKVGGIAANNTYRAEFIYDNLMIESNLINSAYRNGCSKLIFLGSSCIYPKFANQPMREEELLTGSLEYTNEPYAVAKIAGIKLCENYFRQYNANFYSVMPTNLYGINDNFNPETSHVLPALLRKFHSAKINKSDKVTVWGSGNPKREFLYVDDLAKAVYYLAENIEAADIYSKGITHLNIGTGKDGSIAELAELIKQITGFEGEIEYDLSMPDGTPRKLLDVSRINELGWCYKTELEDGIKNTYKWFIEKYNPEKI